MGKGTIGGKIVLEGEKQYKQALKEIKTAQTELKSELKLCSTEFKNNEKSIEALKQKHSIMAKQVEQSSKKVDTYQKMLVASQNAQEQAAEKVDKLKKSLEEETKKLEALSKAEDTTNEALEEQKAKLDGIKDALESANRNYTAANEKTTRYQTALNHANVELMEMKESLRENDRALEEANNQLEPLNDELNEYGKNVNQASDGTQVFGDVLKANLTSEVIVQSVRALTDAVKDAATACIETGMQFEASLSNVKALSGASEEEMSLLAEKAKEMGANTMFSASQAADAFGYMALAGWDTKQMLEGIEPVLNLAAAANMDLAEASDIVTDYLTAFNLEAKDAGKFTDQLAYAMANSNTDVTMLGEAYKNCAATAASLNYSVEETTAVLMTMANAGIKGGEAGTALSAIMTRLATNTSECADNLGAYGVRIYDANGKMNSLSSILQGVSDVWGTLSDQEQAALAKSIAGTNHYAKLQTIMSGLSEAAEESGMSFQSYAEALNSCDGNAKAMADTMQDNLKGKLTILESSLDALKQSAYETFDESLKLGVDGATNAVSRLNTEVKSGSLHVSLNKLGKELSEMAISGAELGEKVLPKIVDGATWLLDNASIIAAGLGGIVTAQVAMNKVIPVIQAASSAWIAYKTANEGATISQWALNAAMNANPVGIIITALAGLTAATIAYTVSLENEKTEAEIAFETLKSGYDSVVASSKELAESSKDFTENTQGEYQYVQSLVAELEDLNSKETLSATEKKRVSDITKELNARYSELNLQIDKQTGKIASNQENWKNLINTQLKQAQLSKVQEELLNIYEQQAENEYNLWDIEQKLAANDEERIRINERLIELQNRGVDATMAEMDEMQKLYDEGERLEEQDRILADEKQKLTASNEELNESTQELNQFMEDSLSVTIDAAGNIQTLGESAGNASAGFSQLNAEVSEAMQEMAGNVLESVQSQMNVFEAFGSSVEISKEELIANLDSQIEGIEKWADNLQILASRGIDEGLLQKLSELGPEGSAYVQAFVEMTDEELADYGEKFSQAAVVPEEVTSQIMASYEELGRSNAEAYKKAQIEHITGVALEEMVQAGYEVGTQTDVAVSEGIRESDATKKAMESMVDEAIESANKQKANQAKDIGKGMVEDIGSGISGSTSAVDAAIRVADDTLNTLSGRMTGDNAVKIGQNMTEGIATGIEKGTQALINAANRLAESVVSVMNSKTQAGMQQSYNSASASSQSYSTSRSVINSISSDKRSVNSVSTESNSQYERSMQSIATEIKSLKSELSKTDRVEVTVGLEPNSQQLFDEMRYQSKIYKESTGQSL